jgi:predicted aspartyl protease
MAGIRYGYQRLVQPPAPFINVSLQHPTSAEMMRNVAAQVDSGADRTVLPEKVVQALKLSQVGQIEIGALGGAIYVLRSFAVLLGVHDFPLRRLEIVTSAEEEWILLGRDVLNNYRIVLNGPQLALEIG